MHLADRTRDCWRRNNVTDSPTGDAVGFRHSIDDDGALAHAIQHDGRNVFGTVINDVFVDFVGHRKNVPLLAELCDQLELLAGEYLAGRVIWSVDDDGL